MEDISLIKKIEAYLHQTLTADESQAFEAEMSSDPGLQKLVEQYRETFKVLQQQWLSMGIKAAAKSLYWLNVLKLFGVSIIGLVSIGLLYFNFTNNQKPLVNKTKEPAKTSVTTPIPEVVATKDSCLEIKKANTLEVNSNNNQPISKVPKFFESNKIDANESVSLSTQIMSSSSVLERYRKTIVPDTQYFSISNRRDTTLYGVQGTEISIPANSLINYQTGKPVKGKIKIELCEFTDYFSLYKGNISTICNDRILQSGGSCFLIATNNGDSVFVKEGMGLKLTFNCNAKDTAMRTFYGNKNHEGIVQWEKSQDKQMNCNDNTVIQTPINDNISVPVQSKVVLNPSNNNGKLTYDTLYFKKTFMKVSAGTGRKGYTHYYENKLLNQNQSFFTDSRSHKKWGEYIVQPVVRYGYPSKASAALANTIFSCKFGYINCDHFANVGNNINVSLSSKDTLIESFLFFQDIKSCMPSYNNKFVNVPRNYNVLILVIYTRDNKYYMGIKEALTEKQIYLDEAEPLDLKKIKSELDKLNQK